MYRNDWMIADNQEAVDVRIIAESGWAGREEMKGAWPQAEPIFIPGNPPSVVVPEAKTAKKTLKAFRKAAQMAQSLHPKHVEVRLAGLEVSWQRPALWGIGYGLYRYRRLGEFVAGPEVDVVSDYLSLLDLAIVRQQSFVRDLVNCPSNLKPPEQLARLMQEDSPDAIEWSCFDHQALLNMNAGGILAVGQGSHRPPVMLVGRYQGAGEGPWLAMVGKGITFDSGGISLKPGDGMGRMKGDMAGAAAVAGCIRVVAEQALPVNLMVVLPLAENLPGGGAYRPGDILTMMDATEVEVISTDAEGRLVLADGVTWARQQKVAAIIDIATLTGANVVALGGIRSALITNDAGLAEMVRAAADDVSEPVWEMPHDEDYVDLIQSSAADIKNSGGRPAGIVTAGLFIGHFAGAVPWVHLDIAGLAFEAEPSGIGAGATGYGVAALVETARRFGQSQ